MIPMKCTAVILPVLATSLMMAGCDNKVKTEGTADKAPAKAEAAAQPAGKKAEKSAKPAEKKAPENPDDLIVSVDSVKFLRKDLDKQVDSILKFYGNRIPKEQIEAAKDQFKKQAAYSFIMKTLLLNQAKKEKIAIPQAEKDKQVAQISENLKKQGKTIDQMFKESPFGEKAARAEFEDGLLIDQLIKKNVLDKIVVTDAEVKSELDKINKQNAETKAKNDSIAAEKKKSLAKIEAIQKRIAGGEKFEEIAKKESDCPSSAKGGDLGTFTRGQMVKPFEDAAFAQEIGKVGKIVETQFGYHLIKVTAKTPAVKATKDKPAEPEKIQASHILVKVPQVAKLRPVPKNEEIKESLKGNRSRTEVQKYIETLKKAAKIECTIPDLQQMLK